MIENSMIQHVLGSRHWALSRERTAPSSIVTHSNRPEPPEALAPAELVMAGIKDSENDAQQDVRATGHGRSETAEAIQDAAAKANQYFKQVDMHLEFVVGEQTGRIVIHVVNNETQEVVRQIPPETLQKFADSTNRLSGLLFEAQG